jgi:hypothetical protein
MGEAWFMSPKRRMFKRLLGDLDKISVRRLQSPLSDIASGTTSFGPEEEWSTWFHYLMPRLVPRSHETFVTPLLELLITAFITQHPGGLENEPYQGFRVDVLRTLGRSLMDSACWPDGALDAQTCLNKYYVERRGVWFWDRPSGPLSASMFFCLKYLRHSEIKPWMDSALRIRAPRWRAQIFVWLIGAHGILTGAIAQPSDLSFEDYPGVDWDWSHILSGHYLGGLDRSGPPLEFVSESNRQAALDCVNRHFTQDVFVEWQGSVATDPSLEAEVAHTYDWFQELYVLK